MMVANGSRSRRRSDRSWMAASDRRLNALLLVGILLIAAIVRFYALDASSLWNDEGTTWALIAKPFGDIARAAALDIHPPGYYWLLKIWTSLLGDSVWAMRSLSALLGIAVVFVVYQIGVYVRPREPVHSVALLAALVASLNPFQVYYSQEARMYMLLTLLAAGLFWSLFSLVNREEQGRGTVIPLICYALIGAAGLWVHYSFPIVIAAAVTAYLVHVGMPQNAPEIPSRRKSVLRFLAANVVILLLYLPWLGTAIERVLNWPKGGEYAGLLDGLATIMQTFVMGPIRTAPQLTWPWLLLALVLPVVGVIALRRQFAGGAVTLWWLAPVVVMLALGIVSDAFLKFLLIASPAWCLLMAAAPNIYPKTRSIFQIIVGAVAVLLAILVLPGYYGDANARDNYAGVASQLAASADPATDIVIINAPGQQDVWQYYDPGLTVLPLPAHRPPDMEATVRVLEEATAGVRHVYGLFWATDESDPARIVETWLDDHAFKSGDEWMGNLRLVTYTFASALECNSEEPVLFGQHIHLEQVCLPQKVQSVYTGDSAIVSLHWTSDAPLDRSYKVSVQLLGDSDVVLAQHDEIPGGGTSPTTDWQMGEIVVDNHGIEIPDDAPPGVYRMIVAVYDPESGERLAVNGTDYLLIGEVEVKEP